jgi:transcriptional regulator with XRE-family HTH domain
MLREKAGLTGQEMAARVQSLGYTMGERSYYNWEAGRATPPLEAFPVLAKALGQASPRSLLPKE